MRRRPNSRAPLIYHPVVGLSTGRAAPARSSSSIQRRARDNQRASGSNSKGEDTVPRYLLRLLPLCIVALTLAGAGPALAGSGAAACCKVTYNAAKTHVQVTGVVAYKGEPILFSFHGPCASPA